MAENEFAWEKLGMKIQIEERPKNHKGDEIVVDLPDRNFIKNENNNTEGYLVLVSDKDDNVIMPKYYDFIQDKIKGMMTGK